MSRIEPDDNFMTVLVFVELFVIFGCVYFYDIIFKRSTNSMLGSSNTGPELC